MNKRHNCSHESVLFIDIFHLWICRTCNRANLGNKYLKKTSWLSVESSNNIRKKALKIIYKLDEKIYKELSEVL